MPGWLIAVICVAAVIFVMDWLIVMGADPKKWKGGKDIDLLISKSQSVGGDKHDFGTGIDR
jgi:hypothetical protein